MKALQLPSIHVWRSGWKKRGFKGRVEVWGMDGKFKSAHKTVQEALDTLPSVKVNNEVPDNR